MSNLSFDLRGLTDLGSNNNGNSITSQQLGHTQTISGDYTVKKNNDTDLANVYQGFDNGLNTTASRDQRMTDSGVLDNNGKKKTTDVEKDTLEQLKNTNKRRVHLDSEIESKPWYKTSDERLKNIFGDNEDAIKAFAKIDSIQFVYNDKAKEIHPGEENGVDGDVHYGVKAQDLEKNPLTASAVSEDASGYKQVDPAELTMANSAVISDICKRLLMIEKVLGIKVV